MKLTIPELSLVVLIGASGSGKSCFARRHFLPTEVLSSDACRAFVSDDVNDQTATKDAFEVLHFIAAKRLAAGRLTVVDATNVQRAARDSLVALARRYHALPVAVVLDLPESICQDRNRERADRDFGPHVIRQQSSQLRRSLRMLKREGFRHVYRLCSVDEVDAAYIERQPLWNNRKQETGPFDIIGDIHGCFDELCDLPAALGYRIGAAEEAPRAHHPDGRKVVFVGDLVDRGPKTPAVLRLAMAMVAAGDALCVPGNHEAKLKKWLDGRQIQPKHGIEASIEQLEAESEAFRAEVRDWIDGLVSHYVLDGGALVVAHAGLTAELQGRGSGKVRGFALYGETTGESDDYGRPVRYDWAADYRGHAHVVYGHTPVPEPEWVNRTLCVDTGCVFGGRLTALRWPEKELVSVPAREQYYAPVKPLTPPTVERPTDLLDIDDVRGKRIIETRILPSVTVRDENAVAALEVISRFAAAPQWLIYLPPTMSPPETCREGDYLEHPREAFDYFRRNGVRRLICEQKHMGSRAVVIVTRDDAIAGRRFRIRDGRNGIVYTRTGRPFFPDRQTETALLARVRAAVDAAGLWDELATDWLCLDCELLPWSAKAKDLLKDQYGAVGCASRAALDAAIDLLVPAVARGGAQAELLTRMREHRAMAGAYVDAYRRYCWETPSLNDYRLAPFHLLAGEGRTYSDRPHGWHMETLARLAGDDGLLMATAYRHLDLDDDASVTAAIDWWNVLTETGGEGMVVKPLEWIVRGKRGLVQPAVKCRGREYLRIIYGPEYTAPEHLKRLRARSLGRKRSLALREYALRLEGLARFVAGEPLYWVHECTFAVLALESEPVDPRL